MLGDIDWTVERAKVGVFFADARVLEKCLDFGNI